MRFLDYIAIVRQRFVLAAAVTAAVALTALAVAFTQDPVFVSRVKLRVRPPAPGNVTNDVLTAPSVREQTDLFSEGEILKSSQVAQRVAQSLQLNQLDTPAKIDRLIERITVLPTKGSIMFVEARAAQPLLAQQLAQRFTEEYLAVRREGAVRTLQDIFNEQSQRVADIQSRLTTLEGQFAAAPPGSPESFRLQQELNLTRADLLTTQERIRTIQQLEPIQRGFGEILVNANTVRAERNQSLGRALFFGILVGGVLALAVVLVLDSLSDTVRTKDDVEAQTEVEVLGIVPVDDDWQDPTVDRLASEVDPFGSVAEYYRTLRHNLARAVTKAGARTILITSPTEGEGKSASAANLGLAYADTGHRVVLVEADLRRPRAYRFLGARPEPGFAELLEQRAPVLNCVQRVRPGLTFVAAGTPLERPDQVITQSDVPETLARLVDMADRPTRPRARRGALVRGGNGNGAGVEDEAVPVLLDGGPVLQAAEVSSLAAEVDGVVLVVRAGVTSRAAAMEAAEQIRRAGGRLLGAVLVGAQGADLPGRRPYLPKFITDLRDQIAGLRAG